jgi:hypothetical protein
VDVDLRRREAADAVDDEEDRVAVAVELRPLPELLRVLERQRGDAEQVGGAADVGELVAVEVQPEEAVGGQELAHPRVVGLLEDLHGYSRTSSRTAVRTKRDEAGRQP